MKRILTISLAVLGVIALTSAGEMKTIVAQGKTNSPLGNFSIEKTDGLEMINGEALRSYEIVYENSTDTLIVAVDDSRKRITRYLVISDGLVVEYFCNKKAFGVKLVDDVFEEEGFYTARDRIDPREYYNQKIICGKPINETECLCLISVYFPKLSKDFNSIYATKN
jgi:hypothetical protein